MRTPRLSGFSPTRRAMIVGSGVGAWLALRSFGLQDAHAVPDTPRHPAPYHLTADDIAWFRSFRSVWVTVESGAPGLLPPGEEEEDFYEAMEDAGSDLRRRYEAVVCCIFLHGTFRPGSWELARPIDGRTRVEIGTDQIRLLRYAIWRYGAIDGKRPYGSYTHYQIDMARILDVPVTRSAEGYDQISPAEEARLTALHREMTAVVQAYVEHVEIQPGDWFVPPDGFESMLRARCRPVEAWQVRAYVDAMAEIAARRARGVTDNWSIEFDALDKLWYVE